MVTQATELPERFRKPVAPAEIELHPGDAGAVALFFALDTQWRRHAMTGQRIGIDYAAIKPTAELAGIELTPAILPALRVMEDAALGALAERRR